MNILKKLGWVYDKLEEILLAGTLGFSVVLIFAQVIARYVFNHSISWSEELARYMFVWLIWLGTSMAAKNNSHITVDVIPGKLHGRARFVLDIIVNLIWLALCVFLAVTGADVIKSAIARGKMASSMPWLPIWTVYLALPFSQAVVGIRVMIKTIQDIVRLARGETDFNAPAGNTEGAK